VAEEKSVISQGLQEGRYYNANGFGVAIVASITNQLIGRLHRSR